MKRLSTLLIILVLGSFVAPQVLDAQSKKVPLKTKIWGKKDAVFSNTTVPEKWKEESAVILFQDYKYTFDKRGSYVLAERTFHTRVALLDNNAVTEYSEFSFNERYRINGGFGRSRGKTITGFKVIKPNGVEKIIDLDNAVSVETDSKSDNLKKLAIPNLEVGDIIDYFYHEVEEHAIQTNRAFTPAITTLSGDYPVDYMRLQFEVEKNFFVNYRPVNGAPQIKEKEVDKLKIYTVEATDIEKAKGTDWIYPYCALPAIKFQVLYTRYKRMEGYLYNFHGQPGELKTEVTRSDVEKFYGKLSGFTEYFNLKPFKVHLETQNMSLKNMTDNEKAIEMYYYLNNLYVGAKLEKYYLGFGSDLGKSAYEFVLIMRAAFKALDVKGEIIVGMERAYGSMEDLLFLEELDFLVRTQGDDPVYFSNFSLHPEVNAIPETLEGTEAYVFKLSQGNNIAYKETLPISKYQDNHYKTISKIKMNEDEERLDLDLQFKLTGLNKDWYQQRYVYMYDYLPKENQAYNNEEISVPKKQRQKLKESKAEYLKSVKESRQKTLEAMVSNDYDTEDPEVSNFEIQKIARFGETDFVFGFDATVDGLLKPAGSNYLLSAGLFIGGQREIAEEDMTRTIPVHMSSARSYSNEIAFTIPEGYTVEGIEKLNMDVQNETGGFVSSAKIKGNQLLIDTQKWYANNTEPAENWSKMLEFLEAAYEFTGVQVLLKKG